MKVKNIVIGLTSEDLLSFCTLQNEVTIKDIVIDNNLNISGSYKLMGLDIKFESVLSILKVENNKVFLDISSFKLLKINIMNSISKKAFNYVIESFTDIEGISFEDKYLKLDVRKIISKYYKSKEIVSMDSLEVSNILMENGEIEITFSDIDVNTTSTINQFKDTEIPHMEAEVVDAAFSELSFTIDEIEEFKENFDENSFFDKVKNYAKNAGVATIYATLILYYTYKDKDVPLTAKAISLVALGYFILPTDIIPDFLLVMGYSDDILALITSIKSITAYINDDIKLKARTRLTEWFDTIDESELDKINVYL